MNHPIESGNVNVWIKPGVEIEAEVLSSNLQNDGAWHYNLQAVFSNENGDAATAQISDVHQSLLNVKK